MRFSLWLDARQPWADLLAATRHAAATGWHGIWLADEVGSGPPALECWTALGALAEAVPGITLGGLVDDDCHRHPAVVTKLTATVDQLSRGRVVLGLKPGSGPDGPARLEESCQVVKCLVECDRAASMEGRFFRLRDAPLDPKPVQRPIPLVIWDDGDPRTIDLAARYATGWASAGPLDGVPDQVASLRQACRAIGRHPGQVAVSVIAPPGLGRQPDQADGPMAGSAVSGPAAGLVAVLGRLADSGVDEWIVAARPAGADGIKVDTLDWLMTQVAPGLG